MKNTSLIRSTSYWVLLALSLASAAIGGWLVWDSTTKMLTTILDGTATNVEVYVGQAWITSGAALLAAGIVGVFLALVLSAARALIPTPQVVVEPIDWGSDSTVVPEASTSSETETAQTLETEQTSEAEDGSSDQNGSNGSIATAMNSSVR